MPYLIALLSAGWIIFLSYLWLIHFELRVRITRITLIVVGLFLIIFVMGRANYIYSLESKGVDVATAFEVNEILHESNQGGDYVYYKRKPILIEAIQYDGDNIEKVLDWCATDGVRYAYTTSSGKLFIRTANGDKHAPIGVYVIRYEESFYTLLPNEFEEEYEKAD